MKRVLNVLPPEAQTDLANRLRQLADALDSGAAQVTDTYASVNMLDTTPEGAKHSTCEPDDTSRMLLLRFVTNQGARPAGNLESYLRGELAGGKHEFRLVAEARADGTLTFYVHPLNADGTTRDFEVRGNLLRPAPHVFDAE